uniref:Myosin-14-like n=1 Tax=Phallusia mammillata TaxID=59560 RepID=A0A6F9DM90_9ASCI|nr:myosin-14-like [Phallusia mammillata]
MKINGLFLQYLSHISVRVNAGFTVIFLLCKPNMANPLPQRPYTAIGNSSIHNSTDFIDHTNPFRTRKNYKKFKEVHLSARHPRKFENVETFNLNPGYRLSKSAGKVYVRINPNTFFDHPKPETPPKKLNVQEMESLVKDLQNQVSTLSTYLEEERLRHGGTRKRASLDLQNLEKELKGKHDMTIGHLLQKHEDEKLDMSEQHEKKLQEIDEENQKRFDSLTNEYRLLKASFKNYRATLQEEMNGQWRVKLDELDWEKRHAIDNAVDDCKKMLEDKFAQERQEMRREFRMNMNDMMREHRQDLEMVTKKLTGGDVSIEELKRRSFLLDEVQQELKEMKLQLQDEQLLVRKTKMELNDARMKLSTLEGQFEARVSAVEDKHRSQIESLTMERADARLKIARSCQDLQSEKIAREIAETERKEAAVRSLEAKIKESEESLENTKETSPESIVTQTTSNPLDEGRTEDDNIVCDETNDLEAVSDASAVLEAICDANKLKKQVREEITRKPKRVSTAPNKVRHPPRFTVPPIDKSVNLTTITIGGFESTPFTAPDQHDTTKYPDLRSNNDDDRPKSPKVIH